MHWGEASNSAAFNVTNTSNTGTTSLVPKCPDSLPRISREFLGPQCSPDLIEDEVIRHTLALGKHNKYLIGQIDNSIQKFSPPAVPRPETPQKLRHLLSIKRSPSILSSPSTSTCPNLMDGKSFTTELEVPIVANDVSRSLHEAVCLLLCYVGFNNCNPTAVDRLTQETAIVVQTLCQNLHNFAELNHTADVYSCLPLALEATGLSSINTLEGYVKLDIGARYVRTRNDNLHLRKRLAGQLPHEESS